MIPQPRVQETSEVVSVGDGYVQRPWHFGPKERAVGTPPGHEALVGPRAIERAVEAVTVDGWHEAYNLNPEDWQEVAHRMLRAVTSGGS